MDGWEANAANRKRWLAMLALVTWLPVGNAAQADGAGNTVRGVVVDAQTRQPIARVLVELLGANGSGVLTDNSGQFRLDAPSAGSMTLQFRRPGYLAPYTEQERASQQVMVSQTMAPVTLSLERNAAIHGQLQVPDGEAADGLRVELYNELVTAGHRRWQLKRSMRVEGDGSFAFDGLQPGSYLVHSQGALDPVPPGSPEGVRSGYIPLYAPGSGELSEATIYTLRAGETADARVRLRRAVYQPVTVKVAGTSMQGGYSVTGNGFTRWNVGIADRDKDAIQTELPSGSYRLHGIGRGEGGGATRGATVEGDLAFQVAGAAVSGLTLQMSVSLPMLLTTRVEGNAPVPALGSVNDVFPRAQFLEFVPADSAEQNLIYDGVDESVSGDTKPLQQAVPPGRYWVVPHVGAAYVASLTAQGLDLLREPLSVVAGSTPQLSLTLRQDGGTVIVTLEGALAGQPCAVQLIPLDGQAEPQILNYPGGGTSPANLRNVAPGSYLAVVLPGRNQIAYREPGVLQGLEGERVQVTAGATAQVTLTRQARLPGSAGTD